MLHSVTSRWIVISASTRAFGSPAGIWSAPLASTAPPSSVRGGSFAKTNPMVVRSVVGLPTVVCRSFGREVVSGSTPAVGVSQNRLIVALRWTTRQPTNWEGRKPFSKRAGLSKGVFTATGSHDRRLDERREIVGRSRPAVGRPSSHRGCLTKCIPWTNGAHPHGSYAAEHQGRRAATFAGIGTRRPAART